MSSMSMVPMLTAGAAAIVIGLWDFRNFRIPNFLTVPLLVSGVLYHTWTSGIHGLLSAVVGMVVGGCILLIPYLMGGIGGGDVKLLAAMGAWLEVPFMLLAFGYSGLLVGAVSLYRLWRNRSLQQSTWLSFRIAQSQLKSLSRALFADDHVEDVVLQENGRDRLIPFGVFFAIGLIIVIGWQFL